MGVQPWLQVPQR